MVYLLSENKFSNWLFGVVLSIYQPFRCKLTNTANDNVNGRSSRGRPS